MADGLTIKITGPDGQRFQAAIATNLGKLQSKWMPVMWYYVVKYFGEVVEGRQFSSEGSFLNNGTQWFGIDALYRARKVAKYGPTADVIGVRSGDMKRTFTNMHGPGGIFDVSGDGMSVTFGGEVFTDKGTEYSQHFNELRKLFGEGKFPPQVEFELGKIMSFVYLQVMRMERAQARGGASIRMDGHLNAPTLDGFRSGPIDKYIGDLSSDLGWNSLTAMRAA